MNLLGIKVSSYSPGRGIAWIRGCDYPRDRHLTYEVGSWGSIGLEIEVGGEDREIKARIGLRKF